MARLEDIRDRWEGELEFAYVYIKEAHPDDEWQVKANRRNEVVFTQPETFAARHRLAKTFVEMMDVETHTLVDDIANTANACYAAWPERIYVIEKGGTIVYKGGMGPFFFDPDELAELLDERYAAGRAASRQPPRRSTRTGSYAG